jgi:hypothetical protein
MNKIRNWFIQWKHNFKMRFDPEYRAIYNALFDEALEKLMRADELTMLYGVEDGFDRFLSEIKE